VRTVNGKTILQEPSPQTWKKSGLSANQGYLSVSPIAADGMLFLAGPLLWEDDPSPP
jgi:hypothetical protein